MKRAKRSALLWGITAVSVLCAIAVCFARGSFASLRWLYALPLWFCGFYVLWFLLAFSVLWFACSRVNMNVEQEHDDKRFRRFAGLYVDAIISATMHLRVSGTEKLPKDGRFVLVCNHLCDLDPVVLLSTFPRAQLAFISKKENRNMFIVGPVMHRIMCQMIDRENDRAALRTIIKCIHLLQDDEVSIGVFPEGYTSRDGKLHHFRSGVLKIAIKAKVPVVVCTIQGTNHVFGGLKPFKLSSVHLGAPVELHLLDVIPPESFADKTAVQLADEVYDKMLADLGEDFRPADAQNT